MSAHDPKRTLAVVQHSRPRGSPSPSHLALALYCGFARAVLLASRLDLAWIASLDVDQRGRRLSRIELSVAQGRGAFPTPAAMRLSSGWPAADGSGRAATELLR
jgi:hypothetical protein